VTQEATGDTGGEHVRTWVVSVTTNLSMDESCVDDTTEVIENDDGTTTYTKRVPPPRSPDP
jgi:hypothetical protein